MFSKALTSLAFKCPSFTSALNSIKKNRSNMARDLAFTLLVLGLISSLIACWELNTAFNFAVSIVPWTQLKHAQFAGREVTQV